MGWGESVVRGEKGLLLTTSTLNRISSRSRTTTLIATLLTVRIILFESRYRLGYLASALQVFPEGDLIAVYDHLVIRLVQFTAELNKRNIVTSRTGGATRTATRSLQVVNIR